jgi:hypothetical protein
VTARFLAGSCSIPSVGRDKTIVGGVSGGAFDPSALARAKRGLSGLRAAVVQHVAPSGLRRPVAATRATIEPLVRSSAHE